MQYFVYYSNIEANCSCRNDGLFCRHPGLPRKYPNLPFQSISGFRHPQQWH
ncbi:MAG: SWIM zinc finger family protein [Tannerella sp.]|nr:SWIM zinc finger family protein [Tannerella sp.]